VIPAPDPAPSGIRNIPDSGDPDTAKSGGSGCCRIVRYPAEPDSEPDSGTPLTRTHSSIGKKVPQTFRCCRWLQDKCYAYPQVLLNQSVIFRRLDALLLTLVQDSAQEKLRILKLCDGDAVHQLLICLSELETWN